MARVRPLGGRGTTGGAVRIVTKMPTTETCVSPDVSIGSGETVRATVDANAALGEYVRVRLNALATGPTKSLGTGLVAPGLRDRQDARPGERLHRRPSQCHRHGRVGRGAPHPGRWARVVGGGRRRAPTLRPAAPRNARPRCARPEAFLVRRNPAADLGTVDRGRHVGDLRPRHRARRRALALLGRPSP